MTKLGESVRNPGRPEIRTMMDVFNKSLGGTIWTSLKPSYILATHMFLHFGRSCKDGLFDYTVEYKHMDNFYDV